MKEFLDTFSFGCHLTSIQVHRKVFIDLGGPADAISRKQWKQPVDITLLLFRLIHSCTTLPVWRMLCHGLAKLV